MYILSIKFNAKDREIANENLKAEYTFFFMNHPLNPTPTR